MQAASPLSKRPTAKVRVERHDYELSLKRVLDNHNVFFRGKPDVARAPNGVAMAVQ
jgi:hypothetical protein